jgi:transcriptional regulator with XRE-family HTH domain
VSAPRQDGLGDRIRRYREEKGLSLSELANASGVSKGYLSTLESDGPDKRPSAETLYAIASTLGVAMSDLLGKRLIIEPQDDVPQSLRQFAAEENLPTSRCWHRSSSAAIGRRHQDDGATSTTQYG